LLTLYENFTNNDKIFCNFLHNGYAKFVYRSTHIVIKKIATMVFLRGVQKEKQRGGLFSIFPVFCNNVETEGEAALFENKRYWAV